ncbi:DUF1552 domain-containing protein [Hyphococcus sp.]|uniref:DUF1552 domain-containing protein n=1 Tax=Hyphococcus sp. TaxID=2038636 RepID=UPI003CCB9B6B
MKKNLNRRSILRGTLGGAAVSVGVPFLDCFLDENGGALAATGESLPVCFGTWFQHLGFNPGRWMPEKVGSDFENNVELKVFDPFRDRMNIISGGKYFMDGRPLETHSTGVDIATTGAITHGVKSPPTIDSIIADKIGSGTRFRSIEVALNGRRQSASKRSGSAINPSEASPLALYERLFGSGFVDPNAAEFKPDSGVMARKSVLSYVADDRKSLMRNVGAADRARLDEYFTSVRQIERQLEIELQEPAPLASCSMPEQPEETETGLTAAAAEKNCKLFASLLAHAVACDQTRVFNVFVGTLGMRLPGGVRDWHSLTHEEPIDEELGYQKDVTWFINWANAAFAQFLTNIEGLREGDGSVFDRLTVLWQTDHGYARTHTMDNLPIITMGDAGGRLRTGLHVSMPGDPATRAGLTIQQALGVPVSTWGALSNETSKTITEIIA